jgi:hypothetical protein
MIRIRLFPIVAITMLIFQGGISRRAPEDHLGQHGGELRCAADFCR